MATPPRTLFPHQPVPSCVQNPTTFHYRTVPPFSGSWDAMGVHFQSGDASGSWADPEIIQIVKDHNGKV